MLWIAAVMLCCSCRSGFFYRASAYWRTNWYSKSICPSVRPSVCYVPVSDENGLTYRNSFFTILQPNHCSVTSIEHSHKILWGAKYRWGWKNSQFSTNKSLSFTNEKKYRHSYYGRRIGTRMQSIKWCHFQWSWTNPNPVFKVTPLFHAKYLANGYRYGHSYFRRRIGTSLKLSNGTNFNDLELPLTPISRSRYYSTSNNSKMVQDRAIFTMSDQ